MSINLITRRESAQASQRRAADRSDERLYVNLHQLTLLQHQARGLSFLPRQPVHSVLSGRHASRVRGRGLNFEEIRQYHAGDDVRTIDWKVTARLRSPHTRVFTEERDRPVLLLVDQRIGMFFGTRVNMKSVTAASAAALAAWRVLDAGDRIGAIVFNDSDVDVIAPGRSRSTVTQILERIVKFNHQLSADSAARPNRGMFAEVLDRANRLATHDFLVVVISDFHGHDETTFRSLRRMRHHNDMIAVLVHDPSASNLPRSRDFVVTDGQLQVELPVGDQRSREKLQASSSGRIARVLELQNQLQMPVMPLSTVEDVSIQLHRLLGRASAVSSPASRLSI
jgi:uncharacterized protein (DUF58 family)